ncbi:proline-rich membrane anchor 1 [Latimeria chalumnae]|uniref:proline-rich membrane anchor 1 n=1 Tax=Latimeria chalumnae TaxID=7897 RepID=UPI00313B7C8F
MGTLGGDEKSLQQAECSLDLEIAQGELQKTCSTSSVSDNCQQICQCRPPPLLPPPPPPPPPPRLFVSSTPKNTFYPIEKPWLKIEDNWWTKMFEEPMRTVIIVAVCFVTLASLLVVAIICYKAIKRKPLRKEENGTSRVEYAMTSKNNMIVDANNAVV